MRRHHALLYNAYLYLNYKSVFNIRFFTLIDKTTKNMNNYFSEFLFLFYHTRKFHHVIIIRSDFIHSTQLYNFMLKDESKSVRII